MSAAAKEPEWLILQKRIFTRWLNQKLALRGVKIDNCVTDLKGEVLVELIEILSEKSFGPKRLEKNPKLRVKQVDNANLALQFMKKCGVETELQTSAENLVDGTEKQVLGMVWAVMRTFMKFGNEEDSKINARDALLAWVKNQTLGYKHVNVVDFTKSFHSGMVLCALIHHFRPKLVDYDKLNPANSIDNLKVAFAAAEKYFGLDQYLKAEDISKLDEKSMIVYVSEYYAGVAAQRKLDVAGRRITKLIKNTQLNDAMRAEYLDKGAQLKALLDRWSKVLQDRAVDNTMAGAQKRLNEFYEYKTRDKLPIIDFYLSVEALYSHLAMRLADHGRPPFVPPAGSTLEELRAAFLPLEKNEQERNVALHEEFNRQQQLVRVNATHTAKFDKLKAWIAAKKAYLETKEPIASSGDAQFQLNTLLAHNDESASVQAHTGKELAELGAQLEKEKYEHSAQVKAREAEISAGFAELNTLAAAKQVVLEDAVARETFKEKTQLLATQHATTGAALQAWCDERADPYLSKKEAVSSVRDAQTALQALASYEREAQSHKSQVAPWKALGAALVSSKYESKSSEWAFPDAACTAVQAREKALDDKWTALTALSAAKHSVLTDDSERETYREKVLLNNTQHASQHATLKAWLDEKQQYLEKKEAIASSRDARVQLDVLALYAKAKTDLVNGAVSAFRALGKEILDAKYESKLSSYVFPSAQEVSDRDAHVTSALAALDALHAAKLAALQDDLSREEYKEKVLLWNSQHVASSAQWAEWAAAKQQYLNKTEHVKSVKEARVALDVLGVYEKGKADRAADLSAFQTLGNEVLSAKYESKLSTYAYDKPEEVTERLSSLAAKWSALDTLSAAKKQALEADLSRELKKEELRLSFAQIAAQTLRFAKDAVETLSSATAQGQAFGHSLATVEAYAAALSKSEDELKADSASYASKVQSVFDAGAALGVAENSYTTATPQQLTGALAEVSAALAKRRTEYESALATQRANDALCKALADVAVPFTRQLQAAKDSLSNTKEDLDGQLKAVQALIAAEAKDGAALPSIQSAQEAIDKAGITHNPHTLLSFRDCTVQWEQYKAFLGRKKKQIEEEIERKKLRGVTPEQYAEIETQFKQFDKDGSGKLDKGEFKACLYSLGYDIDGQAIDKLMKQYSKDDGKHMERAGFTDFMISTLGDTDTKDEIVLGFKLINKGDDVATPARLNDVLSDEMVKYVSDKAPKKGNGLDYVAFTNDLFSR